MSIFLRGKKRVRFFAIYIYIYISEWGGWAPRPIRSLRTSPGPGLSLGTRATCFSQRYTDTPNAPRPTTVTGPPPSPGPLPHACEEDGGGSLKGMKSPSEVNM